MVRHHDVGVDFELILAAGVFERALEEVAGRGGFEIREMLVATEVDGVVVAGGLVAFEAGRHDGDCSVGSTRRLGGPSSPPFFGG
jgi:hypothetical protein